jgi:hypothetical protein
MKEGDTLEWKAVNGICRGVLVKSENGQWICRVDDKTAFQLKDLRNSFSIKLISA